MNWNELEQLIIDYNKTNNKTLLEKITKQLMPLIKKKAKYIYYKKPFYIYKTTDNIFKSINEIVNLMKHNVKDEQIIKFYIYQIKSLDYEDIEQSLWLSIIASIKNFNPKINNFRNYLFASIWNWVPNLSQDKLQELNSVSINNTYDNGEDNMCYEDLLIDNHNNIDEIEIFYDLKNILNNKEYLVAKMLYEQKTLEEISKKLKCSIENVRLIKEKIKKKIENYLK